MVNYVYEPSEIEENHEAYFREGKVALSSGVRKLLRKAITAAPNGGKAVSAT